MPITYDELEKRIGQLSKLNTELTELARIYKDKLAASQELLAGKDIRINELKEVESVYISRISTLEAENLSYRSALEKIAKCKGNYEDWPKAQLLSDVATEALTLAPSPVIEELREVKDALDEISKASKHEIPHYAYGDNEAACDMASRLNSIMLFSSEVLSRLKSRWGL